MRLSGYHINFLLAALFLCASCEKSVITPPEGPSSVKLIHISHTRDSIGTSFIAGVDEIDFSKYEVVMLGGDMLYDSSLDQVEMNLIESTFNISAPNTLWSIGNHDNTSPWMIPSYTGRPLHYAYHNDGITYLVLDSELDDCSIVDSQLALFNNVADTIQESSHLIILTHKLIWMSGNNNLEPLVPSTSNGQLQNNTWDIFPNNFYNDLYWRLLDLQNSGIQVICIGGDIGIHSSAFEYRFDSGIQFLASGVYYNNTESKKALVFEHTKSKRLLTWEYVRLEDL